MLRESGTGDEGVEGVGLVRVWREWDWLGCGGSGTG